MHGVGVLVVSVGYLGLALVLVEVCRVSHRDQEGVPEVEEHRFELVRLSVELGLFVALARWCEAVV